MSEMKSKSDSQDEISKWTLVSRSRRGTLDRKKESDVTKSSLSKSEKLKMAAEQQVDRIGQQPLGRRGSMIGD